MLADSRSPVIARIMALVALERLRARSGDPGIWQLLDEARDVAGKSGTLQRVAPMWAARAEARWLAGDGAAAAQEAALGLELALRKRYAWFASELGLWSGQGGAPDSAVLPEFCRRNPFALEAAGAWRDAAEAWRALGCPFETARALAGGDETAQREALAMLEPLGATPMIERVRRRLRAAGVRGLPRGPRESTQANLPG